MTRRIAPPAERLPVLEMRALRFEEVSVILRLVGRAIAHGCRYHYGPAQREVVFGNYARTLFVDALEPLDNVAATLDGRLVAFAQLDAASCRLRALFVDADEQQRGVGRALLAEVEARAVRRGCARLHGAMSLNAVPFYARAGYAPCAGPERLQATGVPIPIVRMEKRLR
jgi:putative acetyltransferase